MFDDIYPNFSGPSKKPNRDELKRIISKIKITLIKKCNIATNNEGKIIPVRTTEQLKKYLTNPNILQITIENIKQSGALWEAQEALKVIYTDIIIYWPSDHFDLMDAFLKEFYINRCDL
jgi:hypothetical protein